MNEREAIALEMEELKHQGRLDWEMYFELRKHRNQRYNELQDRLREIDERDMNPPPPRVEPPKVPIIPIIQKATTEEELPEPKSYGISPEELKLSRYEEEPKVEIKPSYAEGVELIVEYLKSQDDWVHFNDIQKNVENRMTGKFANFSNLLRRAINEIPNIAVHKINARKFLYRYVE